MLPQTLFSDIFDPELFYQREDVFFRYQKRIPDEVLRKRKESLETLKREVWSPVCNHFLELPAIKEHGYFVRDGVLCTVEKQSEGESLMKLLQALIPWRKGPWNIGGYQIDAEWRSDIKYEGIREVITAHKGASILDIGSGNGYYGYRALDDGASMVLCIDPSEKFFFQFELFQRFARESRIQYELLGYQYARLLPIQFDMVLCMGIVYHQKNPFEVIDCARDALKPGGVLVLESMTYPSDESVSFIPPGRYAKARNVYQVPSASAMVSMCMNSGFQDAQILLERPSSLEEQRRTEYAPYESWSDFLDPLDNSKTIEGYPVPRRAVVIAKKKMRK